MITRRLVRTRQLKEGMKIDQSVVDRAGRNLVQKGSILDNYVIESLLRMGIMMVYIQTGEESDDDICTGRTALRAGGIRRGTANMIIEIIRNIY